MIFTIKRINLIFSDLTFTTKIICAIRTEIINAIHRFIIPKEMNKVISGFETPLIWDYNNTNSFQHPIIKILLRRIVITEENKGLSEKTDREMYQNWFPEKISGAEPANYILNHCWSKPRDIVRLITAAQNSMHNNDSQFSQAVFDSCKKKYSTDSLLEIKEEMRALYTPEEIDCIINCFTGFSRILTIKKLEKRIETYFSNSILSTRLLEILRDLYRLGFIGNYSPASKSYRWQHKSDENLIISEEWSLIIHPALQSALSLSNRHDAGVEKLQNIKPKPNDIVDIVVNKITTYFLLVSFQHKGAQHFGSIHISNLSNEYIRDIAEFTAIGSTFKARVIKFNEDHSNWDLTLKGL